MKIRLKCGVGDFLFEHRSNRYLLQANPLVVRQTLGEFAHDPVKRPFIFGRVSLLVLASGPLRIRKEYHISCNFYEEGEYRNAVVTGFDVPGAALSAARLLLKAGLAESV